MTSPIVIVGMLNSAAMESINFFLLNELVKKRSIGKLEHMANDHGYLLALNLFNFINRQQRFRCGFDLHVRKLSAQRYQFIGVCDKNKRLNGERAFILNTYRFLMNQSG